MKREPMTRSARITGFGKRAVLGSVLAAALIAPAFAQSDADIEELDAIVDAHTRQSDHDDGHNHGQTTAPATQTAFETHGEHGEMAEALLTAQASVTEGEAPFASTYQPYPGEDVAITGATVLTGTGEALENATVLIKDGRIDAVGTNFTIPVGMATIDASGKFVTPGIIDIHSHLGVYPSPGAQAHSDGNEATSPNTAQVWAEHSVWPQDPGFTRALAGGITTLHILPGSANLFGGRGVTLKNVLSRTTQGMKFPGAPYTLKMACGENPKRVYGSRGRSPGTRMGNVAGYRSAWIAAQAYKEQWDAYKAAVADGKPARAPRRNLQLETLAGVLAGEILVQNHCYRADEMVTMLDVAKEFGYKVTTFHHAVEAYKIADHLAEAGTCAAMWADWWGFKLEAYDGIRENVALVENAGACAIVHSDSEEGIQRLNQEAAKSMADGNRIGLDITPATAIQWITSNPAKALGIYDEVGSLESGKAADVVIWNGTPFSVYAQAEVVFVDGARLYDRSNPELSPRTDFEIGQATNDTKGGAGQ